MRKNTIELFNARIAKGAPDACWPWQGFRSDEGYGKLTIDNERISAHRLAYRLAYGDIPPGYQVDHICFSPPCCNPAHLRLLTANENSRRQRLALKATCAKGHEFSGDNLYTSPSGRRNCRACGRESMRRYLARKAA